LSIENRAGVVAPLFDIGREGGALKSRSHLLRDGMEQALEDFKLNGIGSHGRLSSMQKEIKDFHTRRRNPGVRVCGRSRGGEVGALARSIPRALGFPSFPTMGLQTNDFDCKILPHELQTTACRTKSAHFERKGQLFSHARRRTTMS